MSIYSRKKKLHFVGIGGIGMSGIAEILLDLGHRVSGSDRQKSELTDYLEAKGAVVYEGHSAEYINDVDFLVYSSAINKDNPEMKEAVRKNIPRIRRAEMLGQLMNRKFGVAIAGTHGKTTTASMTGNILISAGLDPTIIVGGRIKSLMTNARLGKGEILLAEADEYDRSFLTLNPKIAVITSLETDHLDIYSGLEDIKNTFTQFAARLPFDGSLIVCIDEENIRDIKKHFDCTVITYGFSQEAQLRAENLEFKENHAVFDVVHEGAGLGKVKLAVPGQYNVKNALAAVAVGMELEIPFDKISRALADFTGVDRRFEIKGLVNDVMVVDDYAHHPTEVQAALNGAKDGWDRRVIVIFQPHLYSRTQDFYKEFAKALSVADMVVVTDVYPAREKPAAGVSGALIVDELKSIGHKQVFYIEDKKDVPEFLQNIIQPADMLITMGAGDIWQIDENLLSVLEKDNFRNSH
jgi:UDP-N-acetylmuramate--alanine ligase